MDMYAMNFQVTCHDCVLSYHARNEKVKLHNTFLYCRLSDVPEMRSTYSQVLELKVHFSFNDKRLGIVPSSRGRPRLLLLLRI